jgi:hypothetical protein
MAEFHSFGLEQRPLKVSRLSLSTRTDSALCVDHAMPGYVILGIERRKCPSDLPGRTGHSRQSRYLTIGRNLTDGYSPNDTIDELPALSVCRRTHPASEASPE